MNQHSHSSVDFSAILASSIHDMKNSLGIICDLISQLKKTNTENKNIIQLEFEANRMNNSLVQLLSLYKIETEKFSLEIDQHSVKDMLHDVRAHQASLFSLTPIELEIECDDALLCYCDFNLVCNAINSVLNNAHRYSQKKIILSAGKHEDYIYFRIEDDGAGFPDKLISSSQLDFKTSNTGLGLYFVSTIANLHINGTKSGYMTTSNDSRLGGASFTLYLP